MKFFRIDMSVRSFGLHSVNCESTRTQPWSEMLNKFLMPFLAFHVCWGVQKEENLLAELHRWLVTSWCELHSVGIVYSRGEYFWCRKENSGIFRNVSNLKKVVLKIGVIEGGDFGYDCSSEVKNGRVKSKNGYSQYLLTLLQEILQFEIKFISSTSWGYDEQPNHTLGSLIGSLASNKTEMVGCHWTATERLSQIADFLFSTLETTESFVYLPQNLPLATDIFIKTFSRKLWVFFLLSMFLLIVSFWFSTYMHSRVRPDHEPWSWDEVVLWAVAAISQQSCSRHPRGSSCRTMFLIGYLITYLLYTGFAAGITSLLALQSHQIQLTLNDVADMNLHLILLRDDYYLNFFEKPDPNFKHSNIQRALGENLKKIFEEIRRTNFIGFGSTLTLLHYLHTTIDREKRGRFSVVPVPNSVRRKSFLVQKSFPYKHLFNYWLLRLRENGLVDLGKKRYLDFEEAASSKATKWFGASSGNVSSALVFLLAGWIFSGFVLFMEILWKKKMKINIKKIF